jgi:hypothetical protein
MYDNNYHTQMTSQRNDKYGNHNDPHVDHKNTSKQDMVQQGREQQGLQQKEAK